MAYFTAGAQLLLRHPQFLLGRVKQFQRLPGSGLGGDGSGCAVGIDVVERQAQPLAETLREDGAILQDALPADEAVLLFGLAAGAFGQREQLLLELGDAALHRFLQPFLA